MLSKILVFSVATKLDFMWRVLRIEYSRSAMEKNYLTTEKYYLPSDMKLDAIKLDLR